MGLSRMKVSLYHKKRQKNCPGLYMVHDLYTYLPVIKSQYLFPSPFLKSLVQKLKSSIMSWGIADDPWKLAKKWITPRSMCPEGAYGLGDILKALTLTRILAADIGYKGTQLKITLLLKGGQKAVFKPKWYGIHDIIEGEVYSGADRHNAEITSFYLSYLLGLRMVPFTVGRRVSLKYEILKHASKRLRSTFFYQKGGGICFYGVCYFCHKDAYVCDNGHSLDGSITLWLPSHMPLVHLPHPWSRTYKEGKYARWEKDSKYCDIVLRNPFFSDDDSPRFFDLMDTAIFDFLIQNGDRHHYSVFSRKRNSAIVLLDNGKGFGDPDVDHLDVLAPILQCCRLRQKTYDRLILLSGGGIRLAMEELLSLDPLSPVHLDALNRRLHIVLAALAMCCDKKGGWHNVLF